MLLLLLFLLDLFVCELGPLNKTIHQINENIPIHDLEKVKDIYLQILQEVGTS